MTTPKFTGRVVWTPDKGWDPDVIDVIAPVPPVMNPARRKPTTIYGIDKAALVAFRDDWVDNTGVPMTLRIAAILWDMAADADFHAGRTPR